MLFCVGGTFALFPAQAMRVYGASGASVYSIMFTAFGSAALLGPIASNALLQRGEKPAPSPPLIAHAASPSPTHPLRQPPHAALLPRAGGYPLVFSVLGLCSFGSAALTLASQ